jgi:hypothetical protein
MAALPLKHLLNHDEDSDPEPAHEPPPFYWDENGFLEEYVHSIESCHSAEIEQDHYLYFPCNHGIISWMT